jgi:hypothetical protein
VHRRSLAVEIGDILDSLDLPNLDTLSLSVVFNQNVFNLNDARGWNILGERPRSLRRSKGLKEILFSIRVNTLAPEELNYW